MYINNPSVTKIEAADRVNLLHNISCRFEKYEFREHGECLYPCSDMRHFTIATKNNLAFRHRNYTLDHFIKPRSIFKELCTWLVEVVNANKQLSVSKKFCFKEAEKRSFKSKIWKPKISSLVIKKP